MAGDEDTVRGVIHAFSEKGLAALDLAGRGGRPRLISGEDIKVIHEAATTGPEAGASRSPLEPAQAGITWAGMLRAGAHRAGAAAESHASGISFQRPD